MMMGGLDHFLAVIAKHLSVDKYLEGMRVYWRITQSYHKSVGPILAIPPSELAKVSGTIGADEIKGLLDKISDRVQEGMGDKVVTEIIKLLNKPNPDQSVYLTKQVLFQGMPVHLFLFFFLAEGGRSGLNFFARPKLAEMIKSDMERSGATDVLVELDEDEEDKD
jgi:hypothetical protein